MTRTVLLVGFTLALMAAPATADVTKIKGKLICGSFSSQPKNSPPWHEELDVEIDKAAIHVVQTNYPPPQGATFDGIVAPSGAILIAGYASFQDGRSEWSYEFAGKLNKNGTTQLNGKVTTIKGEAGYRICTMSFRGGI
jgi:hypothetical protein